MNRELGVIKEDGDVVCHRTRTKIVLNPILRILGWEITSVLDTETEEVLCYKLRRLQ